ncbi:TPA: hypothetical protein L4Q76_001664 [Pseudomonas aeruginosa]|uniref:hypothetical protein n=1 Tax=Pseudomonas aeruginosa TaxID=287 RepID=UPI000F82F0E4|nr:hypothetical protein [Pseudomonas aeruginosa]MBH4028454.1 hypothetical protein [Pseudomonas aeruginosa]MBV5530576.1 hypothetical protein [Pseudomonas aeruginosa]RTS98476.1 hypothetical protein DY952_10120 [Pseudomonas aeruginosa]HBO2879648.1 hypothetical protein [Pseudomonas aeruginosa]
MPVLIATFDVRDATTLQQVVDALSNGFRKLNVLLTRNACLLGIMLVVQQVNIHPSTQPLSVWR